MLKLLSIVAAGALLFVGNGLIAKGVPDLNLLTMAAGAVAVASGGFIIGYVV